jgi:hypothetical protein
MIDFFSNFLIVLTGAIIGGGTAGFFILIQIKRNFFKPKLYFKNVQILPTKGEIDGNHFTWGGLILTGELHNDSDYWAYNVRLDDIYAEFLPNTRITIVNSTPLRMVTDLPRSENISSFQNSTQLQNIKPGDNISVSIRILTKRAVALKDYKQLITEMRMIQIKTRIVYENSAGFLSNTLFWFDFQHSRFVNLFNRQQRNYRVWKKATPTLKKSVSVKDKRVEIETEPF